MNEHLIIGELLKLYPNGFTVGPGGSVSKLIFASSRFAAIAMNHPVPPSGGGYMVVDAISQSELEKELKNE